MIGLLDIGGTKVLAATSTEPGRLGTTLRRPTGRFDDIVAQLGDMLEEVTRGQALSAIGVAAPGPFDRRRGVLLNPPGLAAEWHSIDIAGPLAERFGCRVVVENDANSAAVAEAALGAGRGARLMVYVTVSTGIGTAVVLEGRLLYGRHDVEGGHQVLWPAHLGGPPCDCGGTGCLEALASGRAIAARFGRPAEEIDEQTVWDEVGMWLGLAVTNITAVLDCDRVVFGGGVADARWSRLEASLLATLAASLRLQPAPEIRQAELGVERNMLGALLLVDRDGQGGG